MVRKGDEKEPKHHPDKGDDKKPDEDKPKEKEGRKTPGRWPLIIGGVVLLLAATGGGWYWWSHRNLESTDDAYTEGRAVSIAPRVSGTVVELSVTDNQFVRAGDLLLRIDPRDYQVQRDQARAQLDLARTQFRSSELELEIARVRAPAQLQQAEAQRDSARANQAQARADYQRQRSVDPRATTQSNIDTANAALQTRTAAVSQADAEVKIASVSQQTIEQAASTVEQRRAAVAQAEAQLAQAELNLSYTELRAPQDGRVTRRNVEKGALLQPGGTVMSLVTPEVWIAANFKESQLDRMRPGQPVEIEVDAYPDLELRGHIDSIQMGSGARFSAFPAENATGNFVKIVRRVPVKIVIDRGLNPDQPIPLGLSVVPTVNVE
ncbi:HlyD family secretion protein [Roseomonas populi]|uniref:Efflux RND transporter periplasmic adaptor subunit n=1 Tax=Roseomonas populi TaxID=3121582 RepID=A0ABT1X9D0_9PROT|nr:HlyD family secretion protein [Roseomonas pecuniae]MCR0984309.1 efflux RND transporter periplasmic adaptor subunit [Roseomonas pecuniae]